MNLRSALLCFAIISSCLQVFAASNRCLSKIDRVLGAKLSSSASIVHYTTNAPRWSTYYAPRPGTVVNVASENDVLETVKYCIRNNLDFLVQSGGHGWATTFDIDGKDVLINMRGLNQIQVSAARDTITFAGGALVGEMVEAAYQNQVETAIPTCNCVGMSGATVGGGFNRLMGRYGLVIDNVLSFNLITAAGKLTTVTPSSKPDLWWAVRGAGSNFGVVTSVTMKAYPPVNNGLGWIGTLVFTPDRLEEVVQALNDFEYTKEMFGFLYLAAMPPMNMPAVTIVMLYSGPEAEGRAALKPLYDLGPVAQDSQTVPYNYFNSVSELGCTKGLRRPTYTAGLKRLDPQTYRKIWNEYISLISQNPELIQTVIATEMYSSEKVQSFPDNSSAFPHRDINFLALAQMHYVDARLDSIAENFGERIRELWQESSGLDGLRAYVNYGHGDESAEEIYGDSLTRLKKLKKKWDKNGRFSQFFPIPV